MVWGSKLSNVGTGGKLSIGCLHPGLERDKLVCAPDLKYVRNFTLNFGLLLADTMRFCDDEVTDANWKQSHHRVKSCKSGNSAPKISKIDYWRKKSQHPSSLMLGHINVATSVLFRSAVHPPLMVVFIFLRNNHCPAGFGGMRNRSLQQMSVSVQAITFIAQRHW